MKAFHNDTAIKEKYLSRVRSHAAADRLIQGTGWENGKGCAVGCTLEAYDHSLYPVELGIPEAVARLEDRIFEGLPRELAMTWPDRFLSAIPVGADLSRIAPRVMLWGLVDPVHGCRINADEQGKAAIDMVADVLLGWIRTGEVDLSAARSAESAARSAAWSAESAESAAWSAAWSAESAAWSAEASAAWSAEASAAWSAEASAAWSAAWSAARSAAWRAEASAARSAACAARSAAWSAESAESAARSAESAARSDFCTAMSETMLVYLGEA